MLSKTPLTDFISKKEKIIGSSNSAFQSAIRLGEGLPSHGGDYMVVKVMRRKSTKKILFAIAEQDFADFLFSFLTFPLGGVLQKLSGFSSLTCLDNLYRSMSVLSPECVRPRELQNILSKSHVFSNFELNNWILPIETSMLIFLQIPNPLFLYIIQKDH